MSTSEYFQNLNYTLSNEDTRVEHRLLAPGAERVMAIAGSGARILPLIARSPGLLDVVDLSLEQLHLCELRHAAAKRLSPAEYLFFLGYRGGLGSADARASDQGDDRVALFRELELSAACREFWSKATAQWAPHGFILLGRWEGHFQKLGKLFRNGLRMKVMPIFEAHSLEEQQELYRKHWREKTFRAFLRVVASEYVFNKYLYKGHFSGGKGRATEARAPWQFLDEEFRRIFTTTLVRKNYFMQVLFLGRIYFEEGLPIEAQPEILDAVKASKTQVRYLQADLLGAIREQPYSFYSLSDTISYLPETDARAILSRLSPDSPSGSVAVIRSFLRAPEIDPSPAWGREQGAESSAFQLDGTGVYRFHIFRKK